MLIIVNDIVSRSKYHGDCYCSRYCFWVTVFHLDYCLALKILYCYINTDLTQTLYSKACHFRITIQKSLDKDCLILFLLLIEDVDMSPLIFIFIIIFGKIEFIGSFWFFNYHCKPLIYWHLIYQVYNSSCTYQTLT